MSVASDLARNRAVFAALTNGAAVPEEAAESFRPEPFRLGGLPPMAEPAAAPMTRERGGWQEPEAEEAQPRRVVYTLGTIPGVDRRGALIETALAYPEPMGEAAAGEDRSLVPDDTYQSLLRRFDQDARRQSQLGGEEELL